MNTQSYTHPVSRETLSHEDAMRLVALGHARIVGARLVPVISGGDPQADPLFPAVPENLSELDDEALSALESELADAIDTVTGDPEAHVLPGERTAADLMSQTTAAVDGLEQVRAELETRPEVEEPAEETVEDLAASMAELAERARATAEADEPEETVEEAEEPVEEPEAEAAAEVEVPEPEPVVAAAARRRGRPSRSRSAVPTAEAQELVPLVAGAGLDVPMGSPFESMEDIGRAMMSRRRQFGAIPDGATSRETIARANWSHLYPSERTLGKDEVVNQSLIAAALSPQVIKAEMRKRVRQQEQGDALVASGGLCAPVTPYYQLQLLSQADRPVRAALPGFNADRGGIRFAAPASLGAITTAVGSITAANDAAGGSAATKSCQRISCPSFSEVDVAAIFHCLEVGNLPSRTFPELVAQWTGLTMAAQARLAESALLTAIGAASTAVTAATLGLGATASMLGQLLAAANGMRSRHRMDPEAVLRLLLPDWSLDLMISDVIRSQFQRFETDEAKLTALLRSFDIEPTFYIDGASGKSQVFGAQSAGALIEFPSTVVGYLYPEGSFIFVDGGSLELGLVRDSVLNATNDYQLFGETFENLAFVGVESLEISFSACASGTVALPHAVPCPIVNSHTS